MQDEGYHQQGVPAHYISYKCHPRTGREVTECILFLILVSYQVHQPKVIDRGYKTVTNLAKSFRESSD